jgi:hypothetical protein
LIPCKKLLSLASELGLPTKIAGWLPRFWTSIYAENVAIFISSTKKKGCSQHHNHLFGEATGLKTIINSSLNNCPTYWMSMFLLPQTIIDILGKRKTYLLLARRKCKEKLAPS